MSGTRPLAIDLFCGEGGASAGLAAAGFDVVGVDLRADALRRHPCRSVRGDVMRLPVDMSRAALVWASPPCQRFSRSYTPRRDAHPDLIEPVRRMLAEAREHGALTVIENVPGAPLRADLTLRGEMFGLRVHRERIFELGGFWALAPDGLRASGGTRSGELVTIVGRGRPSGIPAALNPLYSIANLRAVMGMPWASRHGLSQAIPPAYAEFIGRAAMRHLTRDAAA